MNVAKTIEEAFTSYLEKMGLAWWVEVVTVQPGCVYYFGPFISEKEAELAHSGYVEDLAGEGAIGIRFQINRCQPTELTIVGSES